MKRASAEQNERLHNCVVIDIALRLISVLILERFCDFVGDNMVSPVKESAAQALGILVKFSNTKTSSKITELIIQLCESSVWEVSHGGLLGLKYIVAVKIELAGNYINSIHQCTTRS